MSTRDLSALRASFQGRLLVDQDEMAPFLVDFRKLWRGAAYAVAQPAATEDVAAVVRWCHRHGVAVVPQGGNTGLSGGAVPDGSGNAIVLSLARLKAVREIDALNNTMTVEAGCILHDVQQAALAAGRLFPLSLAAEGSCTIGGNLATNAGGTAVLRYGNARDLCLGLEVVTAEGKVWNGLRALRKDNTGLDLRDLFVGSEGVLGVITAAVLKLFPVPAGRSVVFVALESPAHAQRLLGMAQAQLSCTLTAFELLSRTCLELVIKHNGSVRNPLDAPSPWYALMEVTDTKGEVATAGLEEALQLAFEQGHITDGVMATSLSQVRELWSLRENISEAQAHEGACVKHDISVPISRIAAFIEKASGALAVHHPDIRLVIFGHMGDGNLHFNLSPPAGDAGASLLARQGELNRIVHDLVVEFRGSISAEHGIGVLRREEAAHYRSAVEMELMRSVKKALDPKGIMNPGKMMAV